MRGGPLGLRTRLTNSHRYKSRDFSASIFLDKIRNMLYVLLLAESMPARRLPGPDEEKPRLFDNLPDHNPRAS
jgi:hypothetical protein